VGLRLRTGRVAAAAPGAVLRAFLPPGAEPRPRRSRASPSCAPSSWPRSSPRSALELLAKAPPRDRAAELQLERSPDHLDRTMQGLKGADLETVRECIRGGEGS